jgi:molybdopterin-guanine dinucleotide biosynthesis protein MobB
VDRYIRNVDIVLSEGFKKNTHPKIEVNRSEMKQDILSTKKDNLLAIASDSPLEAGVPSFDINDTVGLVDLIEGRFLR